MREEGIKCESCAENWKYGEDERVQLHERVSVCQRETEGGWQRKGKKWPGSSVFLVALIASSQEESKSCQRG